MVRNNDHPDYYESVGRFYDANCSNYEAHYWSNQTLQLIRQSFRERLKNVSLQGKEVLEIGTGPGIDIIHFARIFPESTFYGVDVSETMIAYAREKLAHAPCENVCLEKGSIEEIPQHFPGKQFDVIYVFFGALNTVRDLSGSIQQLHKSLKPNGKMVLTFVNKYYLMETLIQLLKLNVNSAFARYQKVWYGYSRDRKVDSYCYTPKAIKRILSPLFHLEHQQGYSIVFPAWYRNHWLKRLRPRLSRILWKIDEKILNKTPAWKWGEYTLFVVQKKDE